MQSHDSNDQRPAQEPADGRRDTEQSSMEAANGLAGAQVPDMADRTVCLSATLTGAGNIK